MPCCVEVEGKLHFLQIDQVHFCQAVGHLFPAGELSNVHVYEATEKKVDEPTTAFDDRTLSLLSSAIRAEVEVNDNPQDKDRLRMAGAMMGLDPETSEVPIRR